MQDFNSIIKLKGAGVGIYFGNAQDCPVSPIDDRFRLFCENFASALSLQGFVVQQQVHGTEGQFIEKPFDGYEILQVEGDFLATNRQKTGLGVLTADCLPVVFCDPQRRAIAIAHAGWRGSLAGIVVKTLEMLISRAGSNPCDIVVYCGPAAGVCCYEVRQDFCEQLILSRSWGKQALVERAEKMYFDQLFFNRVELIAAGIEPNHIIESLSLCTICHEEFYSFRRLGKKAGRQLSCVWIF